MTTLEQIAHLSASLKAPREKDEETNALVREIENLYWDAEIVTPAESEAGLAFLELSEEGDIDLTIPSVARFYRACVGVLAASAKKAA